MAKSKKKRRKKIKRNLEKGQAHIKSTFNNTIITITDLEGNVSYFNTEDIPYGTVLSMINYV